MYRCVMLANMYDHCLICQQAQNIGITGENQFWSEVGCLLHLQEFGFLFRVEMPIKKTNCCWEKSCSITIKIMLLPIIRMQHV